ncbi:MAG: hypothetical protein KAQ64_00545 [Candidatus Pacebacteria bacterium]|nr:hypothetical protein [Candidatus Paceibacterota bacterium]
MIEFSQVDSIFIFLINLAGLWLAFWVYFANPKNKTNQLFILFIIFALLNIDFGHFSNNDSLFQYALILKRLRFGAVALFFIVGYFLFINFPQKSKKKYGFNIIHTLIWSFLFFISILTPLMIKDIRVEEWGCDVTFGGVMIVYYLATTFSVFLFLYILFKKYIISSKTDKLKIQYFLTGIILYAFFNLIFNIIFPVLSGTMKYYQFGDYSVIFLLGFTAYAIVKHELMGIKTLFTQILIVIISIILLIDIFLLSDDLVMQLAKVGILITFLYFSSELVKSVGKEKKARRKLENSYKKIDQNIKDLEDMNVKLKERNEDLGVLLSVSDITTQTLDPKKIAQNIVDSVPKNLSYLKYVASFMVLYDAKAKHAYAYFITESTITKKIRKLLGKTLGKHSGEISNCLGPENLISKTIKKKEIQISDKLEDFIAPSVNVNLCRIIHKLVKAKSYISAPLFSSGRVVGAIIFVSIKSEKEIVQRDKSILSGFSSHVGSAIENAKLYKKTNVQMKQLAILNKNLGDANEKLKELIEVKNEFLHITSHQLRTPLTAIRGMIAMWYEGDFDDLPKKEKRKMIKRILISTERLNNITNDMLDALELEGGFLKFQFKPVSIAKIVKETISTLKPNFEKKNIYIKLETDLKVSNVEVEPNYIRQVFMNTIDNACKYTKKGGVNIGIKKDGKYIKVIIKDTGVGINKTNQRKIFEKFTRGRNAIIENASGSGLGLFIARKIVNAHGGKIEIESEGAGKGTTVKIYLKIKHSK